MLLTPEMVNALHIMIEKRKECGVPDQNEFLFAVPNCLTYYISVSDSSQMSVVPRSQSIYDQLNCAKT